MVGSRLIADTQQRKANNIIRPIAAIPYGSAEATIKTGFTHTCPYPRAKRCSVLLCKPASIYWIDMYSCSIVADSS